ncbi:hypothetical protein LTR62_003191 [Meristemomyces frigidus]|uniref:Uncharacterized protein n=1 Tax=Meristemomyces frigidus TaxID=1508187 RepID=A0AAN7YRX2_9PEZI|nr:hypothetical protein LTR62_003191 [Meristemomyces frigidus]
MYQRLSSFWKSRFDNDGKYKDNDRAHSGHLVADISLVVLALIISMILLVAFEVPPACHNPTLAAEALRNDTILALHGGSGPFPWWQDQAHTIVLPRTDLETYILSPAAGMKAWTWEKWHVAHCVYIWRLGHDVLTRVAAGEQGGVWVDERVISGEHVAHCGNVIANQDHRVGAKAVVTFGYHKCVRVMG